MQRATRQAGRCYPSQSSVAVADPAPGPSIQALRNPQPPAPSEEASGGWLDRARQGLGRVGEGAANLASNAWDTAAGAVSDVYTAATAWHFEGREARNGPPPSLEELNAADTEWQLLPESMSVFHDNGEGKPERKYIHPDGREAVVDGDTDEHVTDPRYMPTYNYVNPMATEEVEGITDIPEYVGRNLGHIALDVVPYLIGGNVRGEH